MKKYYAIGVPVTLLLIFNLGYVFHELIAGGFFKEHIGSIRREAYIIPLIAICFLLYTVFQAYFRPIYFAYKSKQYGWGLTRTAVVFGAIIGFFWDGPQGGLIEVATFTMPLVITTTASTFAQSTATTRTTFSCETSVATSIQGNIALGEKIVLKSTLDAKRSFKLKVKEFEGTRTLIAEPDEPLALALSAPFTACNLCQAYDSELHTHVPPRIRYKCTVGHPHPHHGVRACARGA